MEKTKPTVSDGIKRIRDQFYGDQFMTVAEAAESLPFNVVTIRKFIRDGNIKAKNISLGKKRPTYLIKKSELKKLVPEHLRETYEL